MKSTVKLHVWGDYACFTRPDLKVERVSYDCITPSAACGVLQAIHWKPAIRWVVDKIHVLKPIRFQSIQTNEIKSKASPQAARRAMASGDASLMRNEVSSDRTQRSSLVLRDVAYVIEAHFEMTAQAGPSDNPGKHADIFLRRARKGQCFKQPCLGLRDYSAAFELVDNAPVSELAGTERELGLMLYEFDYDKRLPAFFRARMKDGVLDIAAARKEGLLR